MRESAVISLVCLAFLAGCVGGEANLPEGSTPPTVQAQRGTGSIVVVALDDAQLPVEGASVTLDKKDKQTTGVDGSLEFLNVPVGEHKVEVAKPGYLPATKTVAVAEGEAANLRFSLVSVAVDSAFHETMNQNGIVFCGMSTKDPLWHPGNNSASGNPCVLMAQAGQEEFDYAQIRWFFKFTGSSGFWSETHWTPSSSFNQLMSAIWTPLGDDGASTPGVEGDNCCGTSADPPLRLRIPIIDVENTLKNFTTASCKIDECMLLSYHYVGGETLGPGYPVDVGVGIQQRYEVWVTVFYNGPLPEDFTVVPS